MCPWHLAPFAAAAPAAKRRYFGWPLREQSETVLLSGGTSHCGPNRDGEQRELALLRWEVAELHNRMPVILPKKAWDLWLDPSVQDGAAVSELLVPYPDGEIDFTAVSRMVNSPANDVPQCVEPVRY